jgi:hypothetical protein
MDVKVRKVIKEVEETYYVASDGLEFDDEYKCREHENELTINQAKIDFDFKKVDGCEFEITYHQNLHNKFAQFMHKILYFNYGANRTEDASDYLLSNVIKTIERELDDKLIDNHRYSFEAYTNYGDDDHGNEFVLYVEDITKQEQIRITESEFNECVLDSSYGKEFKETLDEFIEHNYKNIDTQVIKNSLCKLVDNIYNKHKG